MLKKKTGIPPVLDINVDDDQFDDRLDEIFNTSKSTIMTVLSEFISSTK